jgi:phage virion morphogenesis protein
MSYTPESFADMVRDLPRAIVADLSADAEEKVAEEFRQIQRENFLSEQDESGTGWAPRARRYPHPPLRKTLAMFNATTQKGAPGNIQYSSSNQLTLGLSSETVKYARRHQYGVGRMPRRQFFYVNRAKRTRLQKPVRNSARQIIEKHKARFRGRR